MILLKFLKKLKQSEEKYLDELQAKRNNGSIIAQWSFNDVKDRINNLNNIIKSWNIHFNRYLIDKIALEIKPEKYNTKIFSDLNNLEGKSFRIDEIQETVIIENLI